MFDPNLIKKTFFTVQRQYNSIQHIGSHTIFSKKNSTARLKLNQTGPEWFRASRG
jgi:hypothetical protein